MTKFLSFNKLLSHPTFDKLNIGDLYAWQKGRGAELWQNNKNAYVVGYTLDDRAVIIGYDIINERLKFRDCNRLPEYRVFQDIDIRSRSLFGEGFISPEIKILLHPDRNGGRFDFYFKLLLYLMHEFKLTAVEMKSIINASLLESDDMLDVFTVPYTGNAKSRRLDLYSFINSVDDDINDDILIGHMRTINKNLCNYNDRLLHLTFYYGLLIPHLEYNQLEPFKVNLRDLIDRINRRYDIFTSNKIIYKNLYRRFQDALQDRETHLLRTTLQTIRYARYKRDTKLQAQVAKGARVNVIISCGNSDWGD